MDGGGGGNPRRVYGRVGVYWWMEVRQWHIQTWVSATTSANDGRKVAGMQCTCDHSDRLPHKDVAALIPGNRRNAWPVMQWVWLEWILNMNLLKKIN